MAKVVVVVAGGDGALVGYGVFAVVVVVVLVVDFVLVVVPPSSSSIHTDRYLPPFRRWRQFLFSSSLSCPSLVGIWEREED